MKAAQASTAPSSLLRATLTLMTGGALAQALPLLIGPLLTRLFTPEQFGLYHLFAAVAANLAVVACARYEFALPMARDETEAQQLQALSMWLLLGMAVLCAFGGWAWSAAIGQAWPWFLALAVPLFGALSLATLLATRARHFRALATSRVVQHGGGALGQLAAGALGLGLGGLIVAPILAALAAIAVLRVRLGRCWQASGASLRHVARRYRDFPLLNTPHAFAQALQDTLSVALIAATQGAAAAGFWALALRYLKAPATLVGSSVSQALYPMLARSGSGLQGAMVSPQGRAAVRRVMLALALPAAAVVLALWTAGPWFFATVFGQAWRESGELARALALYIGVHFVASPLAVVTMAWQAQAWALKLALVGQACFVVALAVGLSIGGLAAAGWALSLAMSAYFGVYFWKLATWPLAAPPDSATAGT